MTLYDMEGGREGVEEESSGRASFELKTGMQWMFSFQGMDRSYSIKKQMDWRSTGVNECSGARSANSIHVFDHRVEMCGCFVGFCLSR